ncbi:hypothetical protein GCM10009608_26860 [Pseudonocardia alaniniphila]
MPSTRCPGHPRRAVPEPARAMVSTLRRKLFTIPGRLIRSARRLHLPHNWPWETAFLTAFNTITA